MLELPPLQSLALSLFHRPGTHAVLIGSGLSTSAGIPTGWAITLELVQRIAKINGVDEQTDWAEWYKIKYNAAPNYSELINLVAPTADERRDLLNNFIEGVDPNQVRSPTVAHRAIARLAKSGNIRVIITTNFDRLMERALRDEGIEPNIIFNDDSCKGMVPLVHSKCTVIKVHGDYLDTRILNTDEELRKYSPVIENLLDNVLDQYGLLVVGWSGKWDFALRDAMLRMKNRRYQLYWASFGVDDPASNILIDHARGRRINIDSADAFLNSIASMVDALQKNSTAHPVTIQIGLAMAKKYCRSLDTELEWSRFIVGEATLIRSLVEEAINIQKPLAGSECQHLTKYLTQRGELLRQSVLVGARWGVDGSISATKSAIRAASFDSEMSGLTYPFLTSMWRYCASMAFFWVCLGCVARNDYKRLHGFLNTEFWIGSRQYKFKEMLVLSSFDDTKGWKFLDDSKTQRFPGSELWFELFKTEISDLALDVSEAEEIFDKTECIMSIEHFASDEHIPENERPYPRIFLGRYLNNRRGGSWRERLSSYSKLAPWDPIYEAGLLGGNPLNGTRQVEALSKVLANNTRLFW